MNSSYIKALALGLVPVMSFGLVAPAQAQNGPGGYQKNIIAAIKDKKWDEASQLASQCIKVYEPRIKQLGLDDGFGWFYYQKGLALLQLGQAQEALAAFKDCYTKFPSTKNQLAKMAMLREGDTYSRLGEFNKAVEVLEKFLSEYRTDPVARKQNPGEVQAMLARCYFKMDPPQFAKGLDNLRSAVSVRYKGNAVPDASLAASFVAMVECALATGNCDDAVQFIKNYPSVMTVAPFRTANYGPMLVRDVASAMEQSRKFMQEGKAKEADSYAALAYALMGVISDHQEVLADADYTLGRLGAATSVKDLTGTIEKPAVQKVRDQYTALENENKSLDCYLLSFQGGEAMAMGAQRLARAAYQLIENDFPKAPNREDNLYYLAMATWQLGDADKGGALVEQHIKEFPNSKYAPMLNTLSLEGLLKDKKFDLCVQQADKVMELHKDDPKHRFYELALYCKGASLFNLGMQDSSRLADAALALDRFVKEYPDSNYRKTAMYLLGETYTNLGKKDEAIQAFSNYVARYPDKDDANLASILYDRAFNYLTRKNEGDEELAAKDALAIIEGFPNHRLFPYANNLLANLYAGSKEHEAEAGKYYLAAFESAKKNDDKGPASEAVYNLMIDATRKPLPNDKNAAAAAQKERDAEVKKWYDEYWQSCDKEGSRFSLMIGSAAMDYFKEDKDMFEPTMKKLQELIVREGKQDNPRLTVLLEETVGSYAKALMAGSKAQGKEMSGKDLDEHFSRFPGVDKKNDKTLSSMLRMAAITQVQEAYDKTPSDTDEQRELKQTLKGTLTGLFNGLKRDFAPAELPPYTLIKLGMYLANSSEPEEGIVYFDEILNPSESDPVRKQARINGVAKYRKNAIFGKAVALGNSKNAAKIDEAIKMMKDELSSEESSSRPDKAAMEDARYNLVKFTFAREDWAGAIKAGEDYRANKEYKKNLPEVLYLQGLAYLKQKDVDKALANFMNIGSSYKGTVKWSAPALLAQMDALWERNKPSQGPGKNPSDRYLAWQAGEQYVRLLDTENNRKKMTATDQDLINKVKSKMTSFSKDPAVAQERADIEAYKAAVRSAKGQK